MHPLHLAQEQEQEHELVVVDDLGSLFRMWVSNGGDGDGDDGGYGVGGAYLPLEAWALLAALIMVSVSSS